MAGYHYGTALQAASQNGHEKIVQMLLDIDAVVDVNTRPEDDYSTTLQNASFFSHERIVKILLDAGADVNARGGEDDETILQSASRWGHGGVVQLLLGAEAEADNAALRAALNEDNRESGRRRGYVQYKER